MMLGKEYLNNLEHETIERYRRLLDQFGRSPRALGWGNSHHQSVRFEAATSLVNFHGERLLDIGCGFADFYLFLKNRNCQPLSYRGLDINEHLLAIARRENPEAQFECRNILTDPMEEASADVTVMFGLLNFRLKEISNYDYAKEMIQKAWLSCRKALVVDMLSAYREPSYPVEDFVFYYEPEIMFQFAQTLTPHVTLKHDYPSIPTREFMMVLKK